MDKLNLGGTDTTVSSLCLGTMYFGNKIKSDVSKKLLDIYYEEGGRFLDTANKYATWVEGFKEPTSEELLGEWMGNRGNKEEMFVATKLGFPYAGVPRSLEPKIIRQEIEKSLTKLRIDTIDLLYAHVDDPDTSQIEYMRTFHELVQEGKVRHIGASNFLAWRLARANRIAKENDWTPFGCVQSRYSYLVPNRGADFGNQVPATDELVDFWQRDENDLTMLAYSPTLGGCYGRDDRPIPEQYNNPHNLVRMGIIQDIARKRGIDGNQVLLAWMVQSQPPIIPLIAGSTGEQIKQNIESLEVNLTENEMARLNGVDGKLGEVR